MNYRFSSMVYSKIVFLISCAFLLITGCMDNPGIQYPRAPEKELRSLSKQALGTAEEYEPADGLHPDFNTEEYKRIYENPFLKVKDNPLSTFSIDVDTASYSNVRRFLNSGSLPYEDAVRIEELINYFTYEYSEPVDETPFAFFTELSSCPWNKDHMLLHIGLQAKKMSFAELPPNNLVFLLDVSGSMNYYNKLPLLKSALKLLVNEMRSTDKISIVVYAGAAGLVLPATSCKNKQPIIQALDMLTAGGSTAGGAGIQLAYKIAKENYIADGNNRVILATDGDFNVGASSEGELVRMIEDKREQGIFLTVLGFGMGNYKDSKMESLADKGNGNYAYIDNLLEAKKVLVSEMGGTLFTIAKDVKIQVEFNPTLVDSYRLIGYENRILRAEDFSDDTKDAGELGAGHTVTVLYELVSVADGSSSDTDLRYQDVEIKDGAAASNELMFIKFRYKAPDGKESKLLTEPIAYDMITFESTSNNFRFAACVAEFGLILRNSEFKGTASYSQVLELAKRSQGNDKEGYRREFIELVKLAEALSKHN
ncbi:MAG: VWA domain-containing protein [Spirochaetales bacterium]|nr:VWA domain-containing protein [Spirochaetales bacterium]